MYLVFYVGFICKGCVYVREGVKTQGKVTHVLSRKVMHVPST